VRIITLPDEKPIFRKLDTILNEFALDHRRKV